MEGFKANPKMKSELACYKEGGFVTKKEMKREERAEEAKDMELDKKIAKKAMAQHEAAKHKDEEKTELKLKKGGRSKKEAGTVKKYKAGGAIEMKKDAGDRDDIKKVKQAKPKKAKAPSAATSKMPEFLRDKINESSGDEDKMSMPQMAGGGVMGMYDDGLKGRAMLAGSSGLGQALDTGPLGGAAPLGSMRNVNMTPQEADLLRGLQAVGSYCGGGKAY